GIERQAAAAGDEAAVGDETAARALGAEAEVLELHQYRDGEAVVDRDVLDVGGLHAGLGEGGGARPRRRGPGQVDPAAGLAFHGFAGAEHAHDRALEAARDLRPR